MGKQNRKRKIKRQHDWRRKEAEIRELVRNYQFEFTSHVFEKVVCNYWDTDDVLQSILAGHIASAQIDELGDAVDGKKYKILGVDSSGHAIETVGKIVPGEDGREYLIITAY